MKIAHIEAINLRFEYSGEGGFRYSGGLCTARVTTLVRVHTECGRVGLGSCYTHPALAHLLIERQFAPLLLGRDPRRVEELWDLMYGLTRWYGRKGAALSALGALDMAFWDLRGKAVGQPVYRLLGGTHGACPAYASALLWNEPEAVAAEAARHAANGFRRMKLRLGQGEERDIANVYAVRAAIGKELDFMVDAGMRYNVALARRIAQVLKTNDVFWFEEPFEPEDIASYSALRGTIEVPVAAGENEFGVQGFRELIAARAVDIVQPDAGRCGGITETWRVAGLAHEAGLRVAPHTWSDAITVTANAHVVAAIPNGITVEIDQTGNPFIEDLLATPLNIRDGLLHLGDAPGLGIELDEKVVERLRMADPLQVPDGRYSDMVFGAPYYTPAAPYEEIA